MRELLGWLVAVLVHLLLLALPVYLLGALPMLIHDAATLAFLFLTTLFCGTELAAARRWCRPRSILRSADIAARRLALCASLLTLGLFWCGLIERGRSDAIHPLSRAQIGGGLLMLAGTALRVAAIGTLRRFFCTEITIEPDQRLVQWGIYRWLRHPSETGLLGVTLGACLLLQSSSALLLWLFVLVLILARLSREERELAAAFGPHYQRYAARVSRLLPPIY